MNNPYLPTTASIPNIIRIIHNRENTYVVLNKKALWDENLSLEAIGLWARLMSRPDDWQISVAELTKSCNSGRDRILRVLKELIYNGYLLNEVIDG